MPVQIQPLKPSLNPAAPRPAPAGTPHGGWGSGLYAPASSDPLAPVNTVLPVISGTARLDKTLSATTGTWANTPLSYAYQWNRGGVPIGSATSSTYTTVLADLGTVLTVTVTATNAAGSTPATSTGTAAIGNYNLDFTAENNSHHIATVL